MVSFSKYRQCIITAPIVLTACLRVWYAEYAFTRSIHRVRVYAFSIPTRLRVRYTPETLASYRGGALVYRLRSLPQ